MATKLTRGASIMIDTIPIPMLGQLSRTNSPGSLNRTNSNSTAVSALTENTNAADALGAQEKDRDSLTLQSLGRGSMYNADGMLDLTQTELESHLPPLPTDDYPSEDPEDRESQAEYGERVVLTPSTDYISEEAGVQPEAVVTASKAPARRSISAQRAKRGGGGLIRANGSLTAAKIKEAEPVPVPPVLVAEPNKRSELAAIRALTDPSSDDLDSEDPMVYNAPSPVNTDIATNALSKAAVRRESKGNTSAAIPRPLPETNSNRANPFSGGIENDYLPEAVVVPHGNALQRAAVRRKSKSMPVPLDFDDAVPPPPPPPPPQSALRPPPPAVMPPPPSAAPTHNSPQKSKSNIKVLMEENNSASTTDDGSQDARTKMLRAARMKSLYVAVSQRPQSLAEIDVTPYGRIKKVRANSSDMDGYDPSRGSTMSYMDYDSEYRPSELLERDSTFFHDERDEEEEEEEEENQEVLHANQLGAEDENEDLNQHDGDDREGEEEGSADYAVDDAPRSRSSSRSVSPTVPASSFAPVGARKVGFAHAANDQDNDTVGSGSSGNSVSKNALENARSRRSRSASPSATKKPKDKPRASSTQAKLQRGSSSSVFEMFAGIGGGGASTNYIEEAGCTSALEVLQSTSRQPLVRRLFENYCKSDETLDVNLVQQLCYDVGIYYSLLDIRISIKPFVHNTQYIMTDDSFLVWWRSNSDFRYAFFLFNTQIFY